MPIGAGRRPHRVMLQKKQEQYDAANEPIKSWANEKAMWAAIRPMNTYERAEAQKLAGQVSHIVTISGLEAEVTPDKRFVFEDKLTGRTHTLEVVGEMNYDMRSFEVRIACRERV